MTHNGSGFGGGMQIGWPRLTPVVKHVILINVVVFLAMFVLSFSDTVRAWTHDLLGLTPRLWRQYFPFVPLWQLVTAGFLHSVYGLGHIFFNMLGLYFFGTMLEEHIGSRRFLVTYLAAVVTGNALHLVIELVTGGSAGALGASGGLLGVMVACAVLFPNRTVIALFFPVLLKYLVGFLVLMDVFMILVEYRDGGSDGTAHWVHLGGAAYGGIAAWRRWIWRDPIEHFEERRRERKRERFREDELKVDDLLAKISRQGIQSLTKRERDFLKRASERRKA